MPRKCFCSESEAFGIVNIESLKEGTPILSTDTEGARDILKEGKWINNKPK